MTKRISESAADLRAVRVKRLWAVALLATTIAVTGAEAGLTGVADGTTIAVRSDSGPTPPGDSGEGPN
ncbi:hypothetical protein [Amycolatopsis sp. NPDC051102]|uniref:hypothetical protein n=1 Tax=Amycolatopsis sp. NPDC051102 TaxID=3155163 RepID=UPI0034151987